MGVETNQLHTPCARRSRCACMGQALQEPWRVRVSLFSIPLSGGGLGLSWAHSVPTAAKCAKLSVWR